MKILQLSVMSAAVLTAGSLFAQDLKALEEHVTFQMSFEGSVEVDRAEGEIKLQCKDVAKETANSYEKTYYRESVMLRKVQELLVPFAIDFGGEITWTYQGEASHEH